MLPENQGLRVVGCGLRIWDGGLGDPDVCCPGRLICGGRLMSGVLLIGGGQEGYPRRGGARDRAGDNHVTSTK